MSGKSAVSPETLEQISAMRKAIDSLTSDLSNLSHQVTTAGIGRVEELGSYVAQLRERIADLDRAVTALSTTLASLPDKADAEDAPPAFVVRLQYLLLPCCPELRIFVSLLGHGCFHGAAGHCWRCEAASRQATGHGCSFVQRTLCEPGTCQSMHLRTHMYCFNVSH